MMENNISLNAEEFKKKSEEILKEIELKKKEKMNEKKIEINKKIWVFLMK